MKLQEKYISHSNSVIDLVNPSRFEVVKGSKSSFQSGNSVSVNSSSSLAWSYRKTRGDVDSSSEDFDKRLRQNVTLTWKIPGEYRTTENVAKTRHKKRKRYFRGNKVGLDTDVESDVKQSKHTQEVYRNWVRFKRNLLTRTEEINSTIGSNKGRRKEKHLLTLHETSSIRNVDKARSTLRNLVAGKCPHNCECFDCYILNMPECSSDASSGEEVDSVAILCGSNLHRRVERRKAFLERRERRLDAEQRKKSERKAESPSVGTGENHNDDRVPSLVARSYFPITPLPQFVYDYEIFLQNAKAKSVSQTVYDGIVTICRSLLYLLGHALLKYLLCNVCKKTRVCPIITTPVNGNKDSNHVVVDIDVKI